MISPKKPSAKARTMNLPAFAIELPVPTVSEANQREHWARKHKRKKAQQTIVKLLLRNRPASLEEVTRVRLTRIAPRLLDPDNSVGATKHIQDAVAAWLGIDDGDLAVTWEYGREKRSKTHAVRVEIWT